MPPGCVDGRGFEAVFKQACNHVVGKELHAAVGMMNHKPFPGSEQLVRDNEGAKASSLARPPALRMTWASPSDNPAYLAGSSRASMHVSIAKCRAGGSASSPLSLKSC